MTQYGKRDAGVWEHYASDEDALAEAAAAIREGAQQPPPAEPAAPRVGETAVETQRVERFPVAARSSRRSGASRGSCSPFRTTWWRPRAMR